MAQDDNIGDVMSMHISTVDTNHIFLQGYGRYSFYSTDGAKSFKVSDTDSELADVILHPSEKSALLATRLTKKMRRWERGRRVHQSAAYVERLWQIVEILDVVCGSSGLGA